MRKILFWLHLITGTTIGIVVLIMSVTGVLLMYERQIIAWADRDYRSTPSGLPRLGAEALLQAAGEKKPGVPQSLTVHFAATAPVEVAYGRNEISYFDAYSGAWLGDGSRGVRSFFQTVTELHRYLSLQGASRATGKAITGASNLAFLFLVVTGMYLWLPRRWSWNSVRAVLIPRGGRASKARDFNWHNSIGIWSAVPLFFVVLGALVISYPWATNLVYTLTGSEPPKPAAPGHGGGAGRPERQSLAGIDQAWRLVQQQAGEWQTISVRYPESANAHYGFTIMGSHRGRPDKRSVMTIHRATGAVLHSENFAAFNTGRKVRSWLRFIHTGEALGVVGQTIAGLASAGGAVLVWTGIALAWRRFRSWRGRSSGQDREIARAA